MGQAGLQAFSLQQGAFGFPTAARTRSVKGARMRERHAPVGQNKRHQNRGKKNNSARKIMTMNPNSIDSVCCLTSIIASVLRIPGALTKLRTGIPATPAAAVPTSRKV